MTKEIQRFCKENKHLSTRRVANNRQSLELGFFSKNFSRYNISKKSLVSMYVIDGQGTYTSPSGQKQELKPGTFLLRTPNTIHSIERDSTKDWIEFFIIFPETMFQYLQGNNFLPPVNECLDIGIDLFWLDKLKKLILSIQKLTPAKDMQAFHETIDHFMKLKEKISPISNTHQNEEDMLTLCKYIDDNPSRRFTNFELAEKAGYGLENFR
ncbi:MAG: AraC family ligand binding domain-containing protein, partial [Lentisphaeraceae bacterium]|nr:AraC family ligand binding domain-containing protein [Lentisphaeraceae bacterium]